ncbi:MAG: RES domain-containing protein [Terriglobales bacterium]
MIVTSWRITKRKHARHAFTGRGAWEFGGRWNNQGTAVVYTAQSQSLAVLEMLVHLDSSELLTKYVLIGVEFDDSLVGRIEPSALPGDWRSDPGPAELRAIGDNWVLNGSSAVLQVPSALVPGENNFLLNPAHPDFAKLSLGKPLDFRFDPRLRR